MHRLATGVQEHSDVDSQNLQNGPSCLITTPPPILHFRQGGSVENCCIECSQKFPRKSDLDTHAKQTQHAPYACSCGVTFSRRDVLERHLNASNPSIIFPCSYCSKFTGEKAFTRQDKLTSHLRDFHKIDQDGPKSSAGEKKTRVLYCHHEGCKFHQDTSSDQQSLRPSFRTKKEFTTHLRKAHHEFLFSCEVEGCERVAGRGFIRKRDLLKHQKAHI
ncbi:hypothetical protein BGZ60DRAFT_234762 [Tricladium varicosporioides]|nr:hypothetical protein BGZ60DRAFT_234762 [Hymenoscyphus varicosporioides]